MGRRAGREWIAGIAPVARSALTWAPAVVPWVATFTAAAIAGRAQTLPQMRYAGAAVVAAVALVRPSLSLPALAGFTLGSVDGGAWEPTVVGIVVWGAVIAGRLNRGSHPLFAAVWTVFTVSLIVGSLLTSDFASIPVRFLDRLAPALFSMALCWAAARWSQPLAGAGRAPPPGMAVAAGLLIVVVTAGIVGSGPAALPVTVGLASAMARCWPQTGSAGAMAVMTVTAVGGYGFGILAWPAVLLICLLGVVLGLGQVAELPGLMVGSILAHVTAVVIVGRIEPWDLAASWAGSSAGIIVGSVLYRTVGSWLQPMETPPGPSTVLAPIAATLVELANEVERVNPSAEEPDIRVEDIRSEVCGGCCQARECWDIRRKQTVDGLRHAAAEDSSGSRSDALGFCQRASLLALGLGMAIRAATHAGERELQRRHLTEMASGQLRDVGLLLQSLAEPVKDGDRGRAALRYTIGVSGSRRIPKRESWNSFQCDSGRGVLVVGAAGSPNGRSAARSVCRLMIGTAHRMVAAGFSPLTVVRAANLVRGTGPACALDLTAVDLHTGELEVIQVGLTVVILMRRKRMEAIWRQKPTTPGDRDAVVVRRVITPGDTVVMMTNACPDRSLDGMDATLAQLAARYREQSVQRLADSLSTAAAGGRSSGNVTIAVRVDLAT